MNRKYIIKDNILFNKIIKEGKFYKNKYFVIYLKENTLSFPRFGFAVGKKIGNAVARNKLKRQLRDIVRNNMNVFSDKDFIILPKSCCKDVNYDKLKMELIDLTRKGEINA